MMFTDETGTIAERLEEVCGGFEFLEGATTDLDGNVFFSDQPTDRILKWSIAGGITTFVQHCGRANGMCFDKNGSLWVCADEKNELRRVESTGETTTVVNLYDGKLLNGPNDVWVHPTLCGFSRIRFILGRIGSEAQWSKTASTSLGYRRAEAKSSESSMICSSLMASLGRLMALFCTFRISPHRKLFVMRSRMMDR